MPTTVATIKTNTPKRTALLFQAVLAADRGYTSVLAHDGAAVVVTASDGKAVRFERE